MCPTFVSSTKISDSSLPHWIWASPKAHLVENLPTIQETQEMGVQSLSWKDPLEKGMSIHSSIIAQSIPWTEECGGIQSVGPQRVRLNWVTNTWCIHWIQVSLVWKSDWSNPSRDDGRQHHGGINSSFCLSFSIYNPKRFAVHQRFLAPSTRTSVCLKVVDWNAWRRQHWGAVQAKPVHDPGLSLRWLSLQPQRAPGQQGKQHPLTKPLGHIRIRGAGHGSSRTHGPVPPAVAALLTPVPPSLPPLAVPSNPTTPRCGRGASNPGSSPTPPFPLPRHQCPQSRWPWVQRERLPSWCSEWQLHIGNIEAPVTPLQRHRQWQGGPQWRLWKRQWRVAKCPFSNVARGCPDKREAKTLCYHATCCKTKERL